MKDPSENSNMQVNAYHYLNPAQTERTSQLD